MVKEKNDIIYTDDGCKFHPSCLNCPEIPPLSMCVFDFPGYEKGWLHYKKIRYYMIVERLSIEEVSRVMKLKRAYIEEILRKTQALMLV